VSADFDPKKDAANIKKHGVSLSEGDGVLSDPPSLSRMTALKASTA
jgi:uncharacterized DUF497 family protein